MHGSSIPLLTNLLVMCVVRKVRIDIKVSKAGAFQLFVPELVPEDGT